MGLPAKQGLIRNANNTVCNVKHVIGCATNELQMKEIKQNSSAKVYIILLMIPNLVLLCVDGILYSRCNYSSQFQVIEKAGSPHFEVEYKEKTTIFSASDIGTLIYKTMRGRGII